MSRVIGKEQLFNCEQKHFKSIQGYGEHTLFQRYTDIENLVNRNVNERYRYFLAQPVIEGETITWFTKPYKETPRRLSDLLGEDFCFLKNIISYIIYTPEARVIDATYLRLSALRGFSTERRPQGVVYRPVCPAAQPVRPGPGTQCGAHMWPCVRCGYLQCAVVGPSICPHFQYLSARI